MKSWTQAQVIDLLRRGGLVMVSDDSQRENEADFVALGATISAESLNLMIHRACGLVCVPLGHRRAREFALGPMVANNSDPHSTAFTVSVDAQECGTGISVADRLRTIRVLANSVPNPKALRQPGHLFPLIGRQGGLAVRQGHTEAALGLAELAGTTDCAVICEVLAKDGSILTGQGLVDLAMELQIPYLQIETIANWCLEAKKPNMASLPSPWGTFKIQAFPEPAESLLAILGEEHQGEVLVRIHSECLTGDVFASQRCDCGAQLQESLRRINQAGAGLIFYLRQEGRSIGLTAKIAAYTLQDQGLDTYDANLAIGMPVDARQYKAVGQWLYSHGYRRICLLSNNPAKVAAMEACGLQVRREALHVGKHPLNVAYQQCKVERFGHWAQLASKVI